MRAQHKRDMVAAWPTHNAKLEAEPLVSVVIPAYNQANYLGAAIDSVMRQSYPNWELLVVNDASPDHTSAVVEGYDDPRIKLIVHEVNQGLPAARNSGMRASNGAIIALLDADDLFHEEKLQAHVEFLAANPYVDVSYNARYEISADNDVLSIWRPATVATFPDMVMGFPFAPSDMVLRREWAFRVDLFDESFVSMSEDLDINCRLALVGCRFAGIDRPLNYRRYYGNRAIRNVPNRVEGAERALNTLFDNPECPKEIVALRDAAFANLYLVWSYEAFIAELTTLGQTMLGKAFTLNPALLADQGARFHEFLIDRATQDGGDHAKAIHCLVDQLPRNLKWLTAAIPQTIAQADLRAGIREVMWGRTRQGDLYLKRAALTNVEVDEDALRLLVDQLFTYQQLLGDDAAELAMRRLTDHLHTVTSRRHLRWMAGCYWLNRGFASYQAGAYGDARRYFLRCFSADATNMRNRGAWAILLRTLKPSHFFANRSVQLPRQAEVAR